MGHGRRFLSLFLALAASACAAPNEPSASIGYEYRSFNGFLFPDTPRTVVLTLEERPYTWGPVRIVSGDGKSAVVMSQAGVSYEAEGSSTPPSGSEASPSQ
jgi:hypothetical protein